MFLFGPPNVKKMEARRDVKGLIKALGYQKDRGVRSAAAEALVRIGTPAVEPLIVALKDEDSDVRQAAAKALGKIGDACAVEPLIAALKDENPDVRKDAAAALGKIGDARAVEPLIAALKDRYNSVRKAAATALGKIGDPRAVEFLLAILDDDSEDEDTRKACAEALGQIGDLRAVEPLVRALQTWGLSKAAAEALDQLGWQPGQDETAVRYWIAKQEWEQCAALGSVAIETCVSLLEQSAKKGALAQAMLVNSCCFGYPVIVDGEAWMLGIECVEMREAAVKVLSRIGASAVPLLIERLQEPDAWMRMTFAWALGELKDARAVAPLIALLRDERMFAKNYALCDCAPQAVAEALVKIGAPSVEPLIAELTNENPEIRRLIVWTLGEIRDARAAEPLTAMLKEDWAIYQAIAEALKKLGIGPSS